MLVRASEVRLLSHSEGGRSRERLNPFRSQVTLPLTLSIAVRVAFLAAGDRVSTDDWHEAAITFLTIGDAERHILEGVRDFELTEGSRRIGEGRLSTS